MKNNKLELPPKVKKVFVRHMACLNSVNRDKDKTKEQEKMIVVIDKTALELALWISEFKCEKCGSKENLTLHHLIKKYNQYYIAFIKYFKQRHYFGNQCILCLKHHGKIDKVCTEDSSAIPQSKIDKIKKKLGWNDGITKRNR